MASLWYTHSPAFIKELSECVQDFSDYASRVKHKATEMAMDWVNKKQADLSTLSATHDKSMDNDQSFMPDDSFDIYSSMDIPVVDTEAVGMDIKLDTVLQSPIIILPKSPKSSEALALHLGKIILQNGAGHSQDIDASEVPNYNLESIHMEIRDMALYTSNSNTTKNKVCKPI